MLLGVVSFLLLHVFLLILLSLISSFIIAKHDDREIWTSDYTRNVPDSNFFRGWNILRIFVALLRPLGNCGDII
jgi:hypothetical protein